MLNKRFLLPFFSLALGAILLSSFLTPANNSLDNDVLTYTNKLRRSHHKPALIMRDDLSAIARRHSQEMASGRKNFGHDGFNQRSAQIRRIFKSCTLAENVAYGANTGKDAVDQWKNSSGHRRNLLGNYTYVGIGTAYDRQGRIYYTQIFVR